MQTQGYGVDISDLHSLSATLAEYHQENILPDYWHGFFSALAASPIVLPERTWMNLVLNTNKYDEADQDLKEQLRGIVQGITTALHSRSFSPYFPGTMDSWKHCNPSQWCEGFLTASYLWPEDIQQKAGEELPMLTLPIMLFHDPEQYFQNQASNYSEMEWERFMDQNFQFLPEGLYELLSLWDEVMVEGNK